MGYNRSVSQLLYTIHCISTVRTARNVKCMEFSDPSIQDRLAKVRAFARDPNRDYLLGQIDNGMLLVRTARRLGHHKDKQVKCLESARNCEQRAQRSLWRVREQTDVFNQLAAELERLGFEISALANRSI